jgi:hypothetical protein
MQMGSTAVGLDLAVEFVYVECHGQQQELCLHLYLSAQKKAPETHVLLEHAKGPLDLDGTVYSQQNSLVCIDAGFHLHALPLKVFGDVKVLATFF